MFEKIAELQVLYNQMDEITQFFLVNAAPKLTDTGLIPKILDWFCESEKISKHEMTVPLREQFLFIILYLYSPVKLVGKKKKMINKLRITLNEALGITSKNVLSNDCFNLYSYYLKNKSIRKSVEETYLFIEEKLVSNGLMNI